VGECSHRFEGTADKERRRSGWLEGSQGVEPVSKSGWSWRLFSAGPEST